MGKYMYSDKKINILFQRALNNLHVGLGTTDWII